MLEITEVGRFLDDVRVLLDERDELRKQRDSMETLAISLSDRCGKLVEERDRYRERCERLEELARLTDPTERGDLNAPEDMLIGPICERIGYGAVMDSAMRLWRRKDPLGAHTIGPSWILWRRALEVE